MKAIKTLLSSLLVLSSSVALADAGGEVWVDEITSFYQSGTEELVDDLLLVAKTETNEAQYARFIFDITGSDPLDFQPVSQGGTDVAGSAQITFDLFISDGTVDGMEYASSLIELNHEMEVTSLTFIGNEGDKDRYELAGQLEVLTDLNEDGLLEVTLKRTANEAGIYVWALGGTLEAREAPFTPATLPIIAGFLTIAALRRRA